MTEEIADPTNFVSTTTNEGFHISSCSAFSQDASMLALGCIDGCILVYKIPLMEFHATVQLANKIELQEIAFSPCNRYIFSFESVERPDNEYDIVVSEIDISQPQTKYVEQLPVITEAEEVLERVLCKVYAIKIIPTQFRYECGRLMGFEFVIHEYKDILLISKNHGEKIQVLSILSNFAPFFITHKLSINIQDIAVIVGKFYVIHINNLLFVYTRDFRALAYEFKLTNLVNLSGNSFKNTTILDLDASLLQEQSFSIANVQNDEIEYSASLDFANKEFVNTNFAVLHDNQLIFFIIDIVSSKEVEKNIELTKQQVYFNIDITCDRQGQEPGQRPVSARSANCGSPYSILMSDNSLLFTEVAKIHLAEPLKSIKLLCSYKENVIVVSQKGFSIISVEEGDEMYEVHEFLLNCIEATCHTYESKFYAVYVLDGKAKPQLNVHPIKMQRRLKFIEPDDEEIIYKQYLRDSPVLISLPIEYESFGAFFNGFNPVGEYILYVEREDEFDICEDTEYYTSTAPKRSIERIREQVAGLKGWTEDITNSPIDLGFL